MKIFKKEKKLKEEPPIGVKEPITQEKLTRLLKEHLSTSKKSQEAYDALATYMEYKWTSYGKSLIDECKTKLADFQLAEKECTCGKEAKS